LKIIEPPNTIISFFIFKDINSYTTT
jgi:hypothetical protein